MGQFASRQIKRDRKETLHATQHLNSSKIQKTDKYAEEAAEDSGVESVETTELIRKADTEKVMTAASMEVSDFVKSTETEEDIDKFGTTTAEKELRTDLVRYYRECHSKISVSPLIIDNDVPIEEFYVQPPMEAIDLQRRCGNPTKTPVTSYKQLLFRDDDSSYRNIYVTANAGIGKTAFTQKICLTWCQAHSPMTSPASKYDDDDISVMRYFEFLFLIPLRDADRSLCDLDKQIASLIQENLPRRHTSETQNQILEESTCLVIIDGLDEWCHPESCSRRHHEHQIPHRKRRPNWTILNTTRPWKFDVLRLKSEDVDRHVEIKELDEESSEQLVLYAVNLLNQQLTQDQPKKSVEDFYKTTSSMKLGDIRQVPYIYLQSVCLWFEGNDIGGSKCAIYTNVLELTLNRGLEIKSLIKPEIKPGSSLVDNEISVPNCMMEKEYCMQHLTLLLKLGKLAFYTLFGTENRQLLVFDVRVASKYLTGQEIDCCLKLGILSQNKGYDSVAKNRSNISFQHKSLHEYFSALYMQSNDTRSSDVCQNVVKTCTTLTSILEMSNVFIYLSGLGATVYSEISHKLMKYVPLDEHTCRYKQLVNGASYADEPDYNVMFRFQTLQVQCLEEMLANEQGFQSLPIQDILINENSKQAEYMSFLQKLVHGNRVDIKIKSLSLLEIVNTDEVTNIIETLGLQSFHCLDKLELWAVARQPDIEQLLEQSMTSLQYLCLSHTIYEQGIYMNEMTVLSKACEKMIVSMQLLQGLWLDSLIVKHDQLENLTAFLTSRVTMTHIYMENIACIDHEESCPGVKLHLSKHDNIRLLGLGNLPVTQLDVKTQNLEECQLGRLPSNVITSWLTFLPAAHDLHRLYCRYFGDTDIATLIETLPACLQLVDLHIAYTNLNDRMLFVMSDMTSLNRIQLYEISMTSSALRALSCTVSTMSQSINVVLLDCSVTPETEYATVKKEIRESDRFTVIFDGLDANGMTDFTFRTLEYKTT